MLRKEHPVGVVEGHIISSFVQCGHCEKLVPISFVKIHHFKRMFVEHGLIQCTWCGRKIRLCPACRGYVQAHMSDKVPPPAEVDK